MWFSSDCGFYCRGPVKLRQIRRQAISLDDWEQSRSSGLLQGTLDLRTRQTFDAWRRVRRRHRHCSGRRCDCCLAGLAQDREEATFNKRRIGDCFSRRASPARRGSTGQSECVGADRPGVRVHSEHRGSGVCKSMMRWSIDQARQRGCHVVQLTSDKKRPEALRFYGRLEFQSTHEGMKLRLHKRLKNR